VGLGTSENTEAMLSEALRGLVIPSGVAEKFEYARKDFLEFLEANERKYQSLGLKTQDIMQWKSEKIREWRASLPGWFEASRKNMAEQGADKQGADARENEAFGLQGNVVNESHLGLVKVELLVAEFVSMVMLAIWFVSFVLLFIFLISVAGAASLFELIFVLPVVPSFLLWRKAYHMRILAKDYGFTELKTENTVGLPILVLLVNVVIPGILLQSSPVLGWFAYLVYLGGVPSIMLLIAHVPIERLGTPERMREIGTGASRTGGLMTAVQPAVAIANPPVTGESQFCPSCGSQNPLDYDFCRKCGAKLG
jgi:bifunctional DNA-binding transcriptional regulator/antitoxin component of YhaV-PrlF toxin-antitoxin module